MIYYSSRRVFIIVNNVLFFSAGNLTETGMQINSENVLYYDLDFSSPIQLYQYCFRILLFFL